MKSSTVAKWDGPRGKDRAPGQLSPAAASTAEHLELVLDGRVPPCRGPHADLWTSEELADLQHRREPL